MLDIERLSVAYGEARALWDVDLRVAPGELLCIVGPNGAGKTTLVNTIAGVLEPKSGRIRIDGRDLAGLAPHRFCEAGIALVPEGRRLFTGMSVAENLDLGSYLPAAKAKRRETLDEVLALFPALRPKLHVPAGELSGGQQQMAAIGRALMSNPRILLCDEISLGLAPIIIADIYAALPQVKADGTSIVLVEQDIVQAMKVADRVYCFQEGRLSLTGRPKDLTRESIHRAYFGQ
jgi:branched-chain amino acid transport system ATP-binding protein